MTDFSLIETLRWQPDEDDSGQPVLRIDWQEQGGPPVVEPERRGFGSRLIEGSVTAELGGRARLTFAGEGLRCRIDVPRAAATLDGDAEPAGG